MSYTINRYGEEIEELLSLAETAVQPEELAETAQQTQEAAVQASGLYTDGLTGALANLYTTHKNNLVTAINELFQSASDGKTRIAAAITGMGVAAAASEAWSSLAAKIGQIRSGWLNPLVANGGSITPTGSYTGAQYYDAAYGVKIGYLASGDILLSMKAGTSYQYAQFYYILNSAPSGVTLTETHNTNFSYRNAMPGNIYACVLSGITRRVNIGVVLSAVNSSYGYVQASINVTEV